jgi:Flp pilus assembly protein TadG
MKEESKTFVSARRAGRKGFALMLTSLMMIFIASLMGMAVDAGVLFAIRGRLSASVEGAASAASRSVNMGGSTARVNAGATDAARQFLKADFPDRYLGIDPARTKVTAAFTPQLLDHRKTGRLQIAVRAEVAAPVYFMRVLGVPTVPVSVEGKASRRNLVVIAAPDSASSIAMRRLAGFFGPYDHVGTAGKETDPAAALQSAHREIQRIGQKQALNVIVLVIGEAVSVKAAAVREAAARIQRDPDYRVHIHVAFVRSRGSPGQPNTGQAEGFSSQSTDVQESGEALANAAVTVLRLSQAQ